VNDAVQRRTEPVTEPEAAARGAAPALPSVTAPSRASQLEYEAILTNASIGIALTRERRFFMCNPRFAEMFGWTREELIGQSGEIIYPSRESFESLGVIAVPILAAGDKLDVEWELRRRDGAQILCRIVAKAIDPQRTQQGTVWIFEDITAQRRQAAKLEQLLHEQLASKDELERKVQERTLELTERTRELTERERELSLTLQQLEQEVRERRLAEERAQHLADHDALTNLPNRRLLEDRLSQALALNRRNRGHAAVMYVDLDRFKAVNDAHGHAVGDALLKEVAARLVGQLRDVDTICRIGGDEFIIVLPELKRTADAAGVAQKLIDRLAEPFQVDGIDLEVSSSAGISVFPDDGADAETLIRNADAALYYAKDSGRACYRFFTEEMNATASLRITLESELRRASTERELALHFQPVTELTSGIVMGHEALLRWKHPERGLLEPGDFLGVSADAALLAQIDQWVLNEVCRQAARRVEGFVSVNISARQFSDSRLVEQLGRALRDAGLSPGRLEVEIAESIAMRQPDVTAPLLGRISALGVGIVLDRFGSAQSSLASLRQFPIWRLKIDRSIIAQLPASRESRDIVAATVGIGRALGIAIGAVGVENEAQLATLADCGCEFIQGTLSGAPVEWA
jgi:diguanylate cyclase (GGDEF)-like protein/PAS domain S-box-containing protein